MRRWQGWLIGLAVLVMALGLMVGAQSPPPSGNGTGETIRQEWVAIGGGQQVLRVQVRQKTVPFAVASWADLERAPRLPRSGVAPRPIPPGWENWRRQSPSPSRQSGESRLRLLPPAQQPTLQQTFQGVIQQRDIIPPDTIGAAGPNHLVEFTNDVVGIFSKTGTRLREVTLEQFFSPLNPTDIFDPRVLYDQYSGRFIAIALDGSASPNSWIFLAVSETSDPTGRWFFWKIDADMDGNQQTDQWADFPDLGVDRDAVYLTANMYPTTGREFYLKVWVVPKAQLLTGQQTITWTEFSRIRRDPQGNFVFTLRAAHTFGVAPGEYFVSFWDSFPPADTPLQVWRVINPLANPTFEHVANIPIPTGFDQPPVPIPNNGDQQNDFRLLNAVYQNGSVWTAHSIGLQNKSVVRWYEVDVLKGQLKQVGTIDQPAERWYYYPAVAVNNLGDMVISLSGSSQNEFPGVYFTAHLRNDPPGFTHPVQLVKAGEASYSLPRWGDYGGAALDPADPFQVTFWVVNTYALPSDRWGTWWGKVTVPAPSIAVPDFGTSRLTASATEVEFGSTVEYTLQVINSGSADATNVLAKVADLPIEFESVLPLDDGFFDENLREVRWSLPVLRQGESATLRFQATISADATEKQISLTADISAQGVPTFTTPPAVIRLISPSDPFEPNNDPTQAHPLVDSDFEVITPDGKTRITKRAFLARNDQDWFRLSLSPNRLYWLEVRAWQTGSNLNPQLEIYDGTGNNLLASSHDYIGRDPVVLLKSGSGGDILLRVTTDALAPVVPTQGSYRLVVRDVTTVGTLNFVVTDLTQDNALKAGETGIVLGTLKTQGITRPQQVLSFNFPIGLRLVAPSRARFFGLTTPPPSLQPPSRQNLRPNDGDWLLFIADANENALSDVTLPNPSLNLGRIWVQEQQDILFFRVEFSGRAVRSLADLDLAIDLDTDGNLNNGAEFQMRLSLNQTGLFQGFTKKADFAYLNLTERFVDLGVRLGDLNSPTALQVRATLKDLVVGCTDTAPDLGWARLTRADNQVGVFFGVSPAAGTLLGERAQSPDSPVERSLSLWFIVDARTARIETRQTNLALPAAQSTLFSDLSQSFNVEIKQGPPAQLTLDFRVGTNSVTEVPATQRQVTVTATVLDASGNGVAGQRVQLTVSPAELGNFNGATTTELTTDSNGQATTTLSLTGRLGTLTVQGQVLDTSITATKPLAIQQGPPAEIQLITVPALDSQKVTIQVGGKVVVKAALTDGAGNPFPNKTFTLILLPPVGQPKSFTVKDGDQTSSATQLPDEDGSADGFITVTLESGQGKPLGTQAQTWVVSVNTQHDSNVFSQTFHLTLQAGTAAQLTVEEPAELLSATDEPLVRSVGDELSLRVRVTDGFGNPLPNLPVTLTIQQGLSVSSKSQSTDAQGRATFTLPLETASTYQFWFSVGGLRQPSDPLKVFRVQALPPLGDLVAEKVQALGLPFFPPPVPSGQPMPSLSDLLGVPADALEERVFRYDPTRQVFVRVNPANPIDQEGVGAGVGLFAKPKQTVTVRPQRGRLPDRDTVEIPLQRGWNFISFPIAVDFSWILANIQVRIGTATRPLNAATDTVLPILWRWDATAGTYRLVFDGTLAQGDFETTIRPWGAYFVYAFQPATLVVPVPIGARKVTPTRGNSNLRLFTLRVQQGQATTTLVLGLSDNGAALEVPIPPAPTDAPRVALLGTDGTPVALAVRPRQSRLLWSLVVQGKEDGEEVRVGGDNLAALPADLQVRLVDLTTSEQRFLRTGEWRATLKAGETRQLLLVAEPRNGVGLRVQQVKATPMRGRGALISFALTASAQTEVAVFSLTGRLIRLLDRQTYRRAGSHQVHWDGTDAQGRLVPQGAYLVRVRAHDEQGQIAQSGVLLWLR
jgi:hypothetical protein